MTDEYTKQLEATIEELQCKLAALEVENEELVNQRDSAEEDARYYTKELKQASRGSLDDYWNNP